MSRFAVAAAAFAALAVFLLLAKQSQVRVLTDSQRDEAESYVERCLICEHQLILGCAQQQTGRVQLLQGSRWQHGPLAGTGMIRTYTFFPGTMYLFSLTRLSALGLKIYEQDVWFLSIHVSHVCCLQQMTFPPVQLPW